VIDIRIIHGGFEHIELLAPLLDAYRQFYGQDADLEGARSFLHDRIGNLESVVYFALGAREGREFPLGFVQLYPSFSTVSMQRVWNLNDLYVTPEFRRHGVGRALIEKARQLAVATDAKGLVLSTAHDNHESQALYHQTGFIRDDEFHHYFLPV